MQKFRWLLIISLLLVSPGLLTGSAQGDPDAHTLYELNLRAGPGATYAVVAVLPPNTPLTFTARDAATEWLLGTTPDGTRGWVTTLYLTYTPGFAGWRLPISTEVIGVSLPPGDADSAPAAADPAPSADAAGVDAWASYALNLRAGAGTGFAVLTMLPANTGVIAEGRNADGSWLLIQTEDGAYRGWLSALYLRLRSGFDVMALPVSDEVIGGSPAAAPASAPAAPPGSVAEYLLEIPVIPSISGHARAIYASGGTNPHRFTKVGDCNSADWAFAQPFATGQYNLGEYGYLQSTVSFFGGSWAQNSYAAQVGFNALAVTDAAWANPTACEPGESPLWCELRTSRASVAVIMFGANDVYNLSQVQYETSLRQIVEWSIRYGTIPVLSTFAWCQDGPLADKALAMNAATVTIAREFDVPLINFWAAAQALPGCGLAADGTHLATAGPPYGAYFTGDETTAGFTLRNLVVLQTLDALRAAALY